MLVNITIGPVPISISEVWGIVAAHLHLGKMPEVSLIAQNTVWELRLPRAILAALVGAGLAICGVVLQSLLRNGLADPYLLGISSGASTGAVVMVLLGMSMAGFMLAVGAFVGALVSFLCVLLLAWAAGGGTQRIILAGVAITQLFSALTSFLIMLAADANTTRGVLFWLLGSLASTSWLTVWVTAAVLLFVFLVLFFQANALDAFQFGANAAASLGVNVKLTRYVVIAATSLLTAVIVSSSGAIGFVGLVLPHVARLLVGVPHRRVLPLAALLGGLLLVWVDAFSRTVAQPVEIPIGVITALVGVPLFIMLLVKQGKKNGK